MSNTLKIALVQIALLAMVSSCNSPNTKDSSPAEAVIPVEDSIVEPDTIQEIDSTVVIEKETLLIDSSKFKFFGLEEFDLRSWYSGKREEELHNLSKKEVLRFFQIDRIRNEFFYPDHFKYFSIQKNTPDEIIITIIEEDEVCCAVLHYLVYDGHLVMLSDNIVAGTGGDGMWAFDSYGTFLSDSTYTLTRVDTDVLEIDNYSEERRTDSVITLYKYHKSLPFKKLTEASFNTVDTTYHEQHP